MKTLPSYYNEYGALGLIKQITTLPYQRAKNRVVTNFIKNRYSDLIVDSGELLSEYASRTWELDEDLELVRHSLLQPDSEKLSSERIAELLPLAQRDRIHINNNPRFCFKAPFVAEVPDVAVTGENALCFSEDGRVILDTISSSKKLAEHVNSRIGRELCTATSNDLKLFRSFLEGKSPEGKRTISTACVLHSGWTNYYHWMLEHLLKLRGVALYEQETDDTVTLIIPPDPPSYVYESLELLGYNDYIEWDAQPSMVKQLVVPSFPEYTPKTLNWIRDQMFRDVNIECSSPEWIYVTRQNSGNRTVQNYNELLTVLKEYDISPVACEELPLEKQIQLFRNVKGVIGPHGAGLTNILWGTDLSVVELFSESGIGCYFLLSRVLNHDYIAYSGESATTTRQPQNSDIIVDPDALRAILDEAITTTANNTQ